MLTKPVSRWIMRASVALSAFVTLCVTPAALVAQSARSGWFHVIWVDPPRGERPRAPIYGLVDDQGSWTNLQLDEAVIRAAGGVRALDRRRVSVSGELMTGAAAAAGTAASRPTMRVSGVRSLETTASLGEASVTAVPEVKPYVMLLCNFSDRTSNRCREAGTTRCSGRHART